jgi:hypothetical protein
MKNFHLKIKSKPIFFMLLILLASPSYSNDALKYSFETENQCKRSLGLPPENLFVKSYKIYTYPGPWTIFDINGDGWCDWVRGGYEGYRLDQEDPAMKDFIYLGTSKGWRYYDSPKNTKNLTSDEIWKLNDGSLFSAAGANQFFEPIPVYVNNERKPYVVTAVRYDAPAPPPGYDRIYVTRWDDKHDGLTSVPDEEKKAVWEFLRMKLCNGLRDDYEKIHGPRIITLGPLCEKR